jgi:hypothetical protein
VIAIAPEEVEWEVVASVESEFEIAKGKRTQKEEYVGPRGSFLERISTLLGGYLGVSRVMATPCRAFESHGDNLRNLGTETLSFSPTSLTNDFVPLE